MDVKLIVQHKKHKPVERIINGRPLIAVNTQAIIVTSKTPESCPVTPTFAKPDFSVHVDIDKFQTAGPPGGAKDYRGWTFGSYQVCGYGYSNARKRQRKIINNYPKPSWWYGDGWQTRRRVIVKEEIDYRHLWWCICYRCHQLVKDPQSITALNHREKAFKEGREQFGNSCGCGDNRQCWVPA